MKFDEKAPTGLIELQKWFADIITARMNRDDTIQAKTKNGNSMMQEAAKYITASATLEPHERLEIYNQSYWWRLLEVLQDVYPLVVRLFGVDDFRQELAIPYLLDHPSTHWDLNALGSTFTLWIEKNYHANDKMLVLNSAKIDWACQESFSAPLKKPLNITEMSPQEQESLLESPIALQPHICLFALPYNLLLYREEFLKQPIEYWLQNDFPKLHKKITPYFFAIFRNLQHKVEWKELSEGEFLLLQYIKNGASISAACDLLEQQGGSSFEMAQEHIAFWLQEWMIREWCSSDNIPKQTEELVFS